MSIKRLQAIADTTIATYNNELGGVTQNGNMGAADSLEIYSINVDEFVGHENPSVSRTFVKFDLDQVQDLRDANKIPDSGSVKFYLKLFNVEHAETLPKDFYLSVLPISSSWEEGTGLDMDEYVDAGYDPDLGGGRGTTWLYRGNIETVEEDNLWINAGGDFIGDAIGDPNASLVKDVYFENGYEDLKVDVTDIVEKHLNSQITAYGFAIKLAEGYEDTASDEGITQSYYTKKFSARSSEYFFKRPILEARWETQLKDDRGNFYASSSFLSTENTQSLFLYANVNGILKDVGATSVKIYTISNPTTASSPIATDTSLTQIMDGVYRADLVVNTTASTVYDFWYKDTTLIQSGSFNIKTRSLMNYNEEEKYVISLKNLKNSYKKDEVAKFRIFSRPKNWSPNFYTVSTSDITTTIYKNLYYKIVRVVDEYVVFDYDTDDKGTLTSYDKNGNYFELDLSMLENGYSYIIKLALLENGELREFQENFKFKVEQ